MKAKVVLTHSVTLWVEAASEDSLVDWMSATTQEEAMEQVKKQTGNYIEEDWTEELTPVADDSRFECGSQYRPWCLRKIVSN